jgi:hypothetical protein
MPSETKLEIKYKEKAKYLLQIYLKYVNSNSPHPSESSSDKKINEKNLWTPKAVVRSGVAIPGMQ